MIAATVLPMVKVTCIRTFRDLYDHGRVLMFRGTRYWADRDIAERAVNAGCAKYGWKATAPIQITEKPEVQP